MMATHFDLYGCRLKDLEFAKMEVEHALDVKLKPHESDYHGGDYYRFDSSSGESFLLKRNFDAVEGEWFEDQFKEFPILLYVDKTQRPEEIEKRLQRSGPEFTLLRRHKRPDRTVTSGSSLPLEPLPETGNATQFGSGPAGSGNC